MNRKARNGAMGRRTTEKGSKLAGCARRGKRQRVECMRRGEMGSQWAATSLSEARRRSRPASLRGSTAASRGTAAAAARSAPDAAAASRRGASATRGAVRALRSLVVRLALDDVDAGLGARRRVDRDHDTALTTVCGTKRSLDGAAGVLELFEFDEGASFLQGGTRASI